MTAALSARQSAKKKKKKTGRVSAARGPAAVLPWAKRLKNGENRGALRDDPVLKNPKNIFQGRDSAQSCSDAEQTRPPCRSRQGARVKPTASAPGSAMSMRKRAARPGLSITSAWAPDR